MEYKNKKIIIVGAGPSGIAAASKLFENGFTNVKILEAENRIGGRIHTTKLGDYLVDLGGQWVHGEKDNAAFNLANPHGLLDKSDEPEKKLTREFLDSYAKYMSNDVSNEIKMFCDKYISKSTESKTSYESAGQYLEKMFETHFKDHAKIMSEKRKYLDSLELLVELGGAAESWSNISTTSLFRECEGDQMINWKDQGYSMILDVLSKRYPDPSKELPIEKNTILNSEVTTIDYSNDAVIITTANGQIYEADHVIVTVSLGVLKEKHSSLFNPPLPDDKIAAIKGFGFGNIAKVYLLYEKPFWKTPATQLSQTILLWMDYDKNKLGSDPENSWLLGLGSVCCVEHKPNLLQLWVSGPHARAMEALPDDLVLRQASKAMRRFFGATYTVTEPLAVLRTQWYTNPFFRGTCSYRSVETQAANLSWEKLEEPVTPQNLKILFAGEATSEQRYGTVDGAITTGWRAAERLLDHYQKHSTSNQ